MKIEGTKFVRKAKSFKDFLKASEDLSNPSTHSVKDNKDAKGSDRDPKKVEMCGK